ncbi:putative C6 finger domain protein [Stachybotrys elegans]|uniref:C6 finger domain protein n=1 Tax=Stachybotrys elegans TaxID=80388 RepID=A0A8K0SVY9_9HYPO|nr:putative C6 finger domain protein [Stachybotrys elegans]
MDKSRKTHCWECRRRYLVCDSAQPGCKRCANSGVACPGYGSEKPKVLKWLATGQVKSRSRRQTKKKATTPIADTHAASRGLTDSLSVMSPSPPALYGDVLNLGNAVEYFNSCIYQDLIHLNDLGQNPHIYPLSQAHVQSAINLPDYVRFGMLCMVLNHRLNKEGEDFNRHPLTEKFYRYRGAAIKSLRAQLSAETQGPSDLVIAGVLTLLLTDAQHSNTIGWQCHLQGIEKMIALRGGIQDLARRRGCGPLFRTLWFISLIRNTTCPASCLYMTASNLELLDIMLDHHGSKALPFQMCPPMLLADIIKISHLREQAAWLGPGDILVSDLSQQAYAILTHLLEFSPEEWAITKGHCTEDWTLAGKTYQSSVVLYCISSLHSVSVLPKTPVLSAMRAAHSQSLRDLLTPALSSLRIRSFMLWPLVILGVEAVHGDMAVRGFVVDELRKMSRQAGTYAPLTAVDVLESFWKSGETSWDACFDRPYVFTTQIAIDTSRISKEI